MKEHLNVIEQYILLKFSAPVFRQIVREELRRVLSETGILKAVGLQEELLDSDQAAAVLRIKKNTLSSLFSKGKIPGLKKGGRTYFRRSELMAYLESGRKVGKQAGDDLTSKGN